MRVLILLLWSCPMFMNAQSVSGTYTIGDIPTSLNVYSSSCNGPLSTLSVSLPSGGPWDVTGLTITYAMTAQGVGWKSHQRSQVFCLNTGLTEGSVYSGIGDVGGVQNYLRTNVTIANGIYVGGTSMIFQMRDWRTSGGSGCSSTINRVDNFTWMATVYYAQHQEGGSVGIGTGAPDSSAVLDLSSATKGLLPPRMTSPLRLAIELPATGLIVYDTDMNKLFYYSGAAWTQVISDYATLLRDNDNDTKIQVEESPDEDQIRFDLGGIERWVMTGTRLEPRNTGGSVFIGEKSGENNNLASNYNIGIGYKALMSNMEGEKNTAVGPFALASNITGEANTAVGYVSLNSNGSGSYNTANGFFALNNNYDGVYNTAIGSYALTGNYDGVYNTASGYGALSSNSGSWNTANGALSLENNGAGTENTAMGHQALQHNTSGSFGTSIGVLSLNANTIGNGNTAIGRKALISNATGSENVAIGYKSGEGSAGINFNQCTFLGSFSTPTIARTNVTMLGSAIADAQCTNNNQVLLGNTAIGQIRAQVNGITSYSDGRYKTNVTEDIKGLDFITRLRPVSYNVRPTELHRIWGTPDSLLQKIDHTEVEKIRFSGFIGQEVEQAAVASNYAFTGIDIPSNKNEVYTLRYTEFIIPIVKAVQEQEEIIDQLRISNEMLAGQNKALELQYKNLEERLNMFTTEFNAFRKAQIDKTTGVIIKL